jgi:glutamate:Na+ symporter, ESS family
MFLLDEIGRIVVKSLFHMRFDLKYSFDDFDPNLDTPVAEEMVLGSGTAILMALPLFVLLFIPSFTVGSELENVFKWITYLGILTYILIFIGLIIFRTRLKK